MFLRYDTRNDVVNSLNNNLNAMPQWITDSAGKITGYKTKGGADTVFPFNKIDGKNFDLHEEGFTPSSAQREFFYTIPANVTNALLIIVSIVGVSLEDGGVAVISDGTISGNLVPRGYPYQEHAESTHVYLVTAKAGATVTFTQNRIEPARRYRGASFKLFY